MVNDPTFGPWLRTQRRARDLTQEKLARQVGCSSDLIAKIEAGQRRPSRQVAELLATALDIAAADRASFIQWARTGASIATGMSPHGPYKGLRPFQEIDAPDFFGRAAFT